MSDHADGDDAATGLELGRQELIYAGLEALRVARPGIDLVAYLHAAGDNGPQLFLAAPRLGSLKPNDAFDLFSALRDALGPDDHDGRTDMAQRLGGYDALTVLTEGPSSRGLHAIGRLGSPLGDDDREALVPLAEALGAIHHRLEELTRHVVP